MTSEVGNSQGDIDLLEYSQKAVSDSSAIDTSWPVMESCEKGTQTSADSNLCHHVIKWALTGGKYLYIFESTKELIHNYSMSKDSVKKFSILAKVIGPSTITISGEHWMSTMGSVS